jgi:hypothetical protein
MTRRAPNAGDRRSPRRRAYLATRQGGKRARRGARPRRRVGGLAKGRLESIATPSTIASRTSRVTLGTSALILPLRKTVRFATTGDAQPGRYRRLCWRQKRETQRPALRGGVRGGRRALPPARRCGRADPAAPRSADTASGAVPPRVPRVSDGCVAAPWLLASTGCGSAGVIPELRRSRAPSTREPWRPRPSRR